MNTETECCPDCMYDDCRCAYMIRRREVESDIAELDDSYSSRTYTDAYADLARTLADEVDAERAIVTKLLELLEPGPIPYEYGEPTTDQFVIEKWRIMTDLHTIALKIAGRKDA